MARFSGFTVQAYRLLGIVLASLALGMIYGIITLLNFRTPQLLSIFFFFLVLSYFILHLVYNILTDIIIFLKDFNSVLFDFWFC